MISTADRSAFAQALGSAYRWCDQNHFHMAEIAGDGTLWVAMSGVLPLRFDLVAWRSDHDCSPEHLINELREWVADSIVGAA